MEAEEKGAIDFVKERLLPIADDFELARRSILARNEGEASILQQYEGILEKLLETWSVSLGVERIEWSVGKEFDPKRHEALKQVFSELYPENTVVEEARSGWVVRRARHVNHDSRGIVMPHEEGGEGLAEGEMVPVEGEDEEVLSGEKLIRTQTPQRLERFKLSGPIFQLACFERRYHEAHHEVALLQPRAWPC